MKDKIFVFPSIKKKQEFDENFNDGSYIFQYSTKHTDGSVEAHYKFIKNKPSKSALFPPMEIQLNLF